MKTFIDARFHLPPILTLLFIFFANPDFAISFFKGNPNLASLISVPIFIFGLGFLISTFTTFVIIRIVGWRNTIQQKEIETQNGEVIEKLDFLKKFLEDSKNIALEVATWFAVLDNKNQEHNNLQYIRDQLHKRWHATNANINSAMGVIISIPIIYLWPIGFWDKYSWWQGAWWALVLFFIFLFLKLGHDEHEDVKMIDKIMVNRYRK